MIVCCPKGLFDVSIMFEAFSSLAATLCLSASGVSLCCDEIECSAVNVILHSTRGAHPSTTPFMLMSPSVSLSSRSLSTGGSK